MGRPIWFVNLIKRAFPSRMRIAGLTKLPGLGRVVDYALFAGDDIIYLPIDKVIQVNEPINQTIDMVLPSAVVEHFTARAKYRWIMNFCICRDSEGCHNYPVELGCLFLGEAVLKIDSRLGHLASEDEALEHLRRCQEAGLVHMVGRNKLDTIWLGATPGHKLLTICNCCPCCCLWKALPRLGHLISQKVTKMPGVSVSVNDACKGCKLCVRDICFVDAIQMNGKQAVIDADLCRGCGRCVEICPVKAIDINITTPDPISQSIERLSPLVDLS